MPCVSHFARETKCEMGEIHTEITAKEIAEMAGTTVERVAQKWRMFAKGGSEHFAAKFDRNEALSQEQVNLLLEGQSVKNTDHDVKGRPPKGGDGFRWNDDKRAAKVSPAKSSPSYAYVWQTAALAAAFILPTIASVTNTYKVSHQLSSDSRVALAIAVMMSFVPALFIMAGVRWTSVIVSCGVVIFEAFCNLSAIYIALMAGMQYVFGQPRGECSSFLQTVCRLAESDYRATAFWLGLSVAIIIAVTQLTAFFELRKRI